MIVEILYTHMSTRVIFNKVKNVHFLFRLVRVFPHRCLPARAVEPYNSIIVSRDRYITLRFAIDWNVWDFATDVRAFVCQLCAAAAAAVVDGIAL